MAILLTGGAGYIGSHTATVLCDSSRKVVILDNFSNSKRDVIERLTKINGLEPLWVEADVRDEAKIVSTIKKYSITEVIHFAARKSLGESIQRPLEYYSNNVTGLICLLNAMNSCKVKKLVYSSTAAVYGTPQYLPYDEIHPLTPQNPYGRTKLIAEEILKDFALSEPSWSIVSLRYFNPIGAHASALIGEDPQGLPNNLLPYITNVAAGKLPHLNIYGNDYPTKDGTGERDYIHVMDLAEGHLAALNYLQNQKGFHVFNLGNGNSVSVLELLAVFENVTGIKIKTVNSAKRLGDLPVCFADVNRAKSVLGWLSKRTLENACLSAWNFQKNLTVNRA